VGTGTGEAAIASASPAEAAGALFAAERHAQTDAGPRETSGEANGAPKRDMKLILALAAAGRLNAVARSARLASRRSLRARSLSADTDLMSRSVIRGPSDQLAEMVVDLAVTLATAFLQSFQIENLMRPCR
jgi:hypothetical protein